MGIKSNNCWENLIINLLFGNVCLEYDKAICSFNSLFLIWKIPPNPVITKSISISCFW